MKLKHPSKLCSSFWKYRVWQNEMSCCTLTYTFSQPNNTFLDIWTVQICNYDPVTVYLLRRNLLLDCDGSLQLRVTTTMLAVTGYYSLDACYTLTAPGLLCVTILLLGKPLLSSHTKHGYFIQARRRLICDTIDDSFWDKWLKRAR